MLSHPYRLPGFRIPVLLKTGRRFNGEIATIILLKNEAENTRVGILVPMKLSKKAVHRNRSKRLISEVVRLNLSKIKPGFDVIIMAKKLLREEKLSDIEKPLVILLQKAELFML